MTRDEGSLGGSIAFNEAKGYRLRGKRSIANHLAWCSYTRIGGEIALSIAPHYVEVQLDYPLFRLLTSLSQSAPLDRSQYPVLAQTDSKCL